MSNNEPPLLTNEGIADYPDPLLDDPRTLTNVDLGLPPEGVGAQSPEPYYPPDLDVPSDVNEELESKNLYDLTNEAMAKGDRLLATGYLESQKERAAASQMRVQLAGGDPGRVVAPNAKWTDPSVEEQRQQLLIMQREAQVRDVFKQHDAPMFDSYIKDIEAEYRTKNGEAATRVTTGMSEEEIIRYAGSLQPVVRDPNEVGDMRQRLVKMDKALKEIDPSYSVFTHPRTEKFANWISRESSASSLGFLQSGEQRMEGGEGGYFGVGVRKDGGEMGGDHFGGVEMAFAEGVTDFGLNLLYGAIDYAGRAVESMTDGRAGWAAPQNYIMGDDGKLYTNAGKVPGIVETLAAVRAQALGENVREYIGRVNAARNYEAMQATGFDKVVRGTAGVMGMAWGFGLPAGAAMGTGQRLFGGLMTRGLQRMGAGGFGPLTTLALSPRVAKISKIMAGVTGAGVANGLAEGVAFGRHEGFVTAFNHGMAMAPVLMFFGAAGRRAEQSMLFRKVDGKLIPRKHMPEKIAAMISGGLEGVGFGTLEAYQTGALWNFIQDPTMETWQIYLKNVVGFMLFKGMTGRGMLENPAEGAMRQHYRSEARSRFAEQVEGAARMVETGAEGTTLQQRGMVRAPRAPQLEQVGREGPMPIAKSQAEGHRQEIQDLRQQLAEGSIGKREANQRIMELIDQGGEVLRRQVQEGVGEMKLEQAPSEKLLKEVAEAQKLHSQIADPKGQRESAAQQQQFIERTEGFMAEIPPEMRQRMEDVNLLHHSNVASQASRTGYGKLVRKLREAKEAGNEKKIASAEKALKAIEAEVQRMEAIPKERRQSKFTPAPEGFEPGRRTETIEGAEPRTRKGDEPRDPLETPGYQERITDPEMRARIERSGVSEEALVKLGKASRARREARTPVEAEKAYQRQREIEKQLDAMEARQDPVTEARMRELESEGLLDPRAPAGVSAGQAPGGSLGPAANPYRQLQHTPGTEPIRGSDIMRTFEGRQEIGGIRLPFTSLRLGRRPGTAVQVAIRSGRIAERTTLGVFKLFENMTRTKAGLDLVVAAHEWSHAMQRQVLIGQGGRGFTKGARDWLESLPPEAQKDVAKVLTWYPGANKLKKWQLGAEAWAEWFARDLLGDQTLYKEVPALSKWMLEWLGQNPALAGGPKSQYRQLQQQLMRYRLQGSRERVGQSIRRGPPMPQGDWYDRLAAGARKAIDNLVKAGWDDMVALKRSQAKWFEISEIKPEDLDILDNPARMFDTLRMVSAKQAENFLLRGTHTLDFKRKGESLKEILSADGVKNRKIDFVNYVAALRATDLIRKGKPQTLPIEDYLQTVKELENPQFIEAAKRLKVWSDALLDLVGEAGNVSPDDLQRMKDYSPVYVPFIRALDGPRPSSGGRGVAERGSGLRGMKGDTGEIQDPVKSLEDVTRAMITKAHQSMVMKSLYKMTLKAEVGGLATVVPRKNVPAQYRIDQAFRAMQERLGKELPKLEGEEFRGEELTEERLAEIQESFGMLGELASETGISDQLITLFGQKAIPYSEKDAIVAYTPRLTEAEINSLPKDRQAVAREQNNKMQWMELDVPAYEALMGIDQPTGNSFLDLPIVKQIVGYPVKWTRLFATELAPAFSAANALRDAMSEPIFNADGKFRPFGGFSKMIMGGAEMLKNGEYAQMYQASGAGVSSFFNEGVRREMRGETSSIIKESRNGVLKAVDTMKRWLSNPESFIRISEFKKIHQEAKAEGKSDLEAAFRALEAAREVTINFARGGVATRFVNQMVPYFNSSFQGQRKMLRALTGAEGRTPEQRARIQRAAFANGIVGITVPTLGIWALFKDEEWYQDLPEWRKRGFVNMKFQDDGPIISLPLPFELGILFGSLPQIWADTVADSNPAAIAPTLGQAFFPYLHGIGAVLPAFVRPLIENVSDYHFFFGQSLTPYWTSRQNPPEEQVRQSTSKIAQLIFKEFRPLAELAGAENPIELENLIGGYTAGAGVTGLRIIDEMFDLKNHPGIQDGFAAPLSSFYNRFARQTPHGSSRAVQEMYALGDRLAATPETEMNALRRGVLSNINAARQQISDLRKSANAGRMSREEADRRSFEIATRAMQGVR